VAAAGGSLAKLEDFPLFSEAGGYLPVPEGNMRYALDQLNLVPAEAISRLAAVHITDTDQLLEQASTPSARQRLADSTGLPAEAILTWAGMSDLVRVKGVGRVWAQLLVCSGEASNIQELLGLLWVDKTGQRRPPQAVDEAAGLLHERLAVYASQGSGSGRPPSKQELIAIAEEAAELKPRLVTSLPGDRSEFSRDAWNDLRQGKRFMLKTLLVMTALITGAIIAGEIFTRKLQTNQIAQLPQGDIFQVKLVEFYQIATEYKDWSTLVFMALLLLAMLVLLLIYESLTVLIEGPWRIWLFNTPAYQGTYKRIIVSQEKQKRNIRWSLALFTFIVFVEVAFMYRATFWDMDIADLLHILVLLTAIGGSLMAVIVTLPTLRFLFNEYKKDPAIEPAGIQRYLIYLLSHAALLPVMVVLFAQVTFPGLVRIHTGIYDRTIVPQVSSAVAEVRTAILAIDAQGEATQESREVTLRRIDRFLKDEIESYGLIVPPSDSSLLDTVIPAATQAVAWMGLVAVLGLFIAPYFVLGGWKKGVFYAVLLGVSFGLENRLQQTAPGWFNLKAPSPASVVVIALAIFASALFFDWLYDRFTEHTRPCPGCSKMIDPEVFYCPICGLVQS
jgi:hypothetical protein